MIEDPSVLLERWRALPAAQALLERLQAAPPDLYLVGGAVRDLMLDRDPLDLDLVVEAELGPVLARLGAAGRPHDRFATATVALGGVRVDLARARREGYPQPGALPTVAPASLAQDLKRRDFTVNAIALAVLGPRRGELTAVPSALQDLRTGALRVLHDASFSDDPTRLLRLARYAGRLGFAIEPLTRELAGRALAADALQTVSGSRLGAELALLAAESDPTAALLRLGELEIDAALADGFGVNDPVLARRALDLLPPDGDRVALVIAAASLRVPPARLTALLQRLAFDGARRDGVLAAARDARRLALALGAAILPSEVAAAAEGARVEAVALAGALGPAAAARRWLEELRFARLEIDGRDLLAAGIRSGPAVGRALRAALAAKLDGQAVGREAELAEALRSAKAGG